MSPIPYSLMARQGHLRFGVERSGVPTRVYLTDAPWSLPNQFGPPLPPHFTESSQLKNNLSVAQVWLEHGSGTAQVWLERDLSGLARDWSMAWAWLKRGLSMTEASTTDKGLKEPLSSEVS